MWRPNQPSSHQTPQRHGLVVLWCLCLLALSSCREEPVFDGGTAETFDLIFDVQSERDEQTSPVIGDDVFFRSVVVTAYDSYAEPNQDREQINDEYVCIQTVGYAGGVVVQEADGGERSGISLFNPALIPAHEKIGPGTIVDIRGTYLEFCLEKRCSTPDDCAYIPNSSCAPAPNTLRLSQLGNATVERVGEANEPDPEIIPASLFDDEEAIEPYEGVLVQVNERLNIDACRATDSRGRPNCCVGDYDRYGNLETRSINIYSEFYSVPVGTRCITSVTGIVTWFGSVNLSNINDNFGTYSISPRSRADVIIPDDCRALAE